MHPIIFFCYTKHCCNCKWRRGHGESQSWSESEHPYSNWYSLMGRVLQPHTTLYRLSSSRTIQDSRVEVGDDTSPSTNLNYSKFSYLLYTFHICKHHVFCISLYQTVSNLQDFNRFNTPPQEAPIILQTHFFNRCLYIWVVYRD